MTNQTMSRSKLINHINHLKIEVDVLKARKADLKIIEMLESRLKEYKEELKARDKPALLKVY